MADEHTTTPEEPQEDYIAAITELKENTVSKQQYAQLKEENSKLLKALINGEAIDGIEQPSTPDIEELRKQLFSGEAELNNLDYVIKTLELRDALIARGAADPFLPIGHQITPSPSDIEAANRVATVLNECVDYADGDSNIFTTELQRKMVDAMPARPPKK